MWRCDSDGRPLAAASARQLLSAAGAIVPPIDSAIADTRQLDQQNRAPTSEARRRAM
jgi:hypothetical protein